MKTGHQNVENGKLRDGNDSKWICHIKTLHLSHDGSDIVAESQLSYWRSPFQMAPLKLGNTGKPPAVNIPTPRCGVCNMPSISQSYRFILDISQPFDAKFFSILVKVYLPV